MHLHYLDSPVEHGSEFILNQLGVLLGLTAKNNCEKSSKSSLLTVPIELGDEFYQEHIANTTLLYEVISGSVYIDVRDTANCWIRCVLMEGDVISLPPALFRRFSNSSTPTISNLNLQQTSTIAPGDILKTNRYAVAADSISVNRYHKIRELVCDLCKQFFVAGWVTGTGGSISIRHGNRIYMTPSGVQKEIIQPDELFVLDIEGNILSVPHQKSSAK
jgi:hypothetical protein